MAKVRVRDNESIESALRRFKNNCRKTGIFAETKKRRFYEKPSEIRKKKRASKKRRGY